MSGLPTGEYVVGMTSYLRREPIGVVGQLLPWNVPLSVDCNYATDMDTLSNGATGVLDIL